MDMPSLSVGQDLVLQDSVFTSGVLLFLMGTIDRETSDMLALYNE